jgi:hypothetical protein
VEDSSQRDQDQVVCRGTRSKNDPDAMARVVMVDQLWLWILDDSQCFPSFFIFPSSICSNFGGN